MNGCDRAPFSQARMGRAPMFSIWAAILDGDLKSGACSCPRGSERRSGSRARSAVSCPCAARDPETKSRCDGPRSLKRLDSGSMPCVGTRHLEMRDNVNAQDSSCGGHGMIAERRGHTFEDTAHYSTRHYRTWDGDRRGAEVETSGILACETRWTMRTLCARRRQAHPRRCSKGRRRVREDMIGKRKAP